MASIYERINLDVYVGSYLFWWEFKMRKSFKTVLIMLSVRPRPAINAVFLFHETLVLMLIPSNFRTRMSQNIPLSGREILAEFSSTNLEQLESAVPWSGNPRNTRETAKDCAAPIPEAETHETANACAQGNEAGISPFVRWRRIHISLRKNTQAGARELQFGLLAARMMWHWKVSLFRSCFMWSTSSIQLNFMQHVAWTSGREQKFFSATELFRKIGYVTRGNLSLQPVSASDSNKSPSVWRRPVSGWERRRRRRFLVV